MRGRTSEARQAAWDARLHRPSNGAGLGPARHPMGMQLGSTGGISQRINKTFKRWELQDPASNWLRVALAQGPDIYSSFLTGALVCTFTIKWLEKCQMSLYRRSVPGRGGGLFAGASRESRTISVVWLFGCPPRKSDSGESDKFCSPSSATS